MPPRGTPSLWPVSVLTDFGKAAFVLWSIAALLIVVALVAPMVRDSLRSRLLRLATELQYLLLAVLVPIAAGEFIKWIVGRGRPFVGGHANAFNFSHFAGTSAYASFPSAHAITSFRAGLRGLGAVAAAAHPNDYLCLVDYSEQTGVAGPSSQ